MAKNKWLSQLQKLDGAVVDYYDPHKNVIQTFSPSVNFCFGNGHGLPYGFTIALGGPPKGGKSVLCHSMIGQLHQSDPDAIAVKFDTEFRSHAQMDEGTAAAYGIDLDRLQVVETNTPKGIFDQIEQDLAAQCQAGMPLKLVIIDSITGIQGRRSMNADSIETQQIGDLALTLQEGFKRILPVQRKCKFAIVLTCQVRAEMDALEQKRGNKVKMALPFGVQHYAEYFMFVEANRNKDGRTDILGNDLKDDETGMTDMAGNEDQIAHKIRVKMKDSSCGPKGRVGEFTLAYHNGRITGIKNVQEEAFLLGVNRGVISKPNNLSYEFGGQKWTGKPAMLQALENDLALRTRVLDEVFKRDQPGAYDDETAEEAEVA
jgi:hypothetical protein